MATNETQTAVGIAPPVKRRSACDECRLKKLKCTGEHPTCSRCVRENITCVYSAQKQMGRPKKRQKTRDTDSPGRDAGTGDTDPSLDAMKWDNAFSSSQTWLPTASWDFSLQSDNGLPALTPDSGTSNYSPPMLDLPTELLNTSHIHSHQYGQPSQATHADLSAQMLLESSLTGAVGASLPSCACLSTLYLQLQNLQSMDSTYPFPSSLHPLREAITAAAEVIRCEECPTRFLSAVQNTQLVGTLLVSIAERFSRILLSITAEAERAESEGEKKSLPLSSLNTSTTHLHPHALGSCIAAFSVSLTPEEWRALAKKVVRAEVYGPRDGNHCCANFWWLTEQMLDRQKRWHRQKLPDDCPRDPVTGMQLAGANIPEKDHMCIKLGMYSRKLMEGFDWS